MRRLPLSLALLLLLMKPAPLTADPPTEPVAPGFSRGGSAANPRQSRSVVVARQGMVAASQPLASLAGVEILKRGGTAADAAIAANAVLGLVEPMSCGIGGDLFVIYWDNATQRLYGLNASGRSPYALNLEVFRQQGLAEIPLEGPLCWSVPGCVAGWEDLRSRFGRLSLAEILAPAIEHAEQGFAVSEIIAGYWQSDEKNLAKFPDAMRVFLPHGHAPVAGEIFRNSELAASYRAIAEQGPAAYYRGAIAEEIVRWSESNGGFMSLRDLAEHANDWIDPVSTNYRGYDVWELPPNGQGIAALQMLNLLEPYDVRSMGFGSPEYLHLFIEAKKLAFADRAQFYADPAFADVPTAELISKEYAERQRQRIDLARAAVDVPVGDPRLVHGDTIYLTVVDAERNCCSLIQSNYYGFGSKVVPGNVGFAMQNRGALFALEDGHLNRLEPHKRPFHTIIPAMVTRGGRPVFSFGVMGGDFQPQGHVQTLVNIIDFGMNVQQAADAARIAHAGSATPTGTPMAPDGGTVTVEPGISDATIEGLIHLGHQAQRDGGGYGGYQGIWIDWEHGTLHGGTDPRKDGCALGY